MGRLLALIALIGCFFYAAEMRLREKEQAKVYENLRKAMGELD